MNGEAAFAVIVAFVVASAGAFAYAPPVPRGDGPIVGVPPGVDVLLWETNGRATPCGGQVTQVAEDAPMDFGLGCSGYWLIVSPNPAKASAEVSYFESHRQNISGVIFNDFQYSSMSSATEGSLYTELLNQTEVCAVVYPYLPQQPDVTRGHCVIAAMHVDSAPSTPAIGGPLSLDITLPEFQFNMTVDQWKAAIQQNLDAVQGNPVVLLAYDAPTRAWPYPAPPNYLLAMAELGGGFLEVWN